MTERKAQRSKVIARTTKADRARLVDYSPRMLAKHVIGIGESMDRDVDRLDRARQLGPVDAMGASKSYEAHMLAHDRANLLAICDELRKRIDLLLAGGEVAS